MAAKLCPIRYEASAGAVGVEEAKLGGKIFTNIRGHQTSSKELMAESEINI